MQTSVTKWGCMLCLVTGLNGAVLAQTRPAPAVSPAIAVPKIEVAPLMRAAAGLPILAPTASQQASAATSFVAIPAGFAIRPVEVPRLAMTPSMDAVTSGRAVSRLDGRTALDAAVPRNHKAKADPVAVAQVGVHSDTAVATDSTAEIAARTDPAASKAVPAPKPSCR